MDLSNIIIDPEKGTFVPFVNRTKVLGSIFTSELDDTVDVISRIQAANGVFGRYSKRVFALRNFPLLRNVCFTSLL